VNLRIRALLAQPPVPFTRPGPSQPTISVPRYEGVLLRLLFGARPALNQDFVDTTPFSPEDSADPLERRHEEDPLE
jgi:hypothetical protein